LNKIKRSHDNYNYTKLCN